MDSSESLDGRDARLRRRKEEQEEKEQRRACALSTKPTDEMRVLTTVFWARKETRLMLSIARSSSENARLSLSASEDLLSALEENRLVRPKSPTSGIPEPLGPSLSSLLADIERCNMQSKSKSDTKDAAADQLTNNATSSAKSKTGGHMSDFKKPILSRSRRQEPACFLSLEIPNNDTKPTNLISFRQVTQYARDSHQERGSNEYFSDGTAPDSCAIISKWELSASIIDFEEFESQTLNSTRSTSSQSILVHKTALALKKRDSQEPSYCIACPLVIVWDERESKYELLAPPSFDWSPPEFRPQALAENFFLPFDYNKPLNTNASNAAPLCAQFAKAMQLLAATSQDSQHLFFPSATSHQATTMENLRLIDTQQPPYIESQSIPMFDASHLPSVSSPILRAPPSNNFLKSLPTLYIALPLLKTADFDKFGRTHSPQPLGPAHDTSQHSLDGTKTLFSLDGSPVPSSPLTKGSLNWSFENTMAWVITEESNTGVQHSNTGVDSICSTTTASLVEEDSNQALASTSIQQELVERNLQVAVMEKQQNALKNQLKRERNERYDEVKTLKEAKAEMIQTIAEQQTTIDNLTMEKQNNIDKINNIESKLLVAVQDREVIRSVLTSEHQQCADQINELEATLSQERIDRDISETDIREGYETRIENIEGKLHLALKHYKGLREEKRAAYQTIDQLQGRIWEHAKENLWVTKTLELKKRENDELIKEQRVMQQGFDEECASMKERFDQELAHTKERSKEELDNKADRLNSQKVQNDVLIKNERLGMADNWNRLEKPCQLEIEDLMNRLNDALHKVDGLSRELKTQRQDHLTICEDVESDIVRLQEAVTTAEENHKEAIAEVKFLKEQLYVADQNQQAFEVLQKQHEEVLDNVKELENNLQQARLEVTTLQNTLEQNKQKALKDNAEANSKLENAIGMFARVEDALAREKEANEKSELKVVSLEAVLTSIKSVEQQFQEHLVRTHKEEVYALNEQILVCKQISETPKDLVQALLPLDEPETPPQKPKKRRGNKAREIDHNPKLTSLTFWHVCYRSSDYQKGRVGFGSEDPHPLVEEGNEAIEEVNVSQNNSDEVALPNSLDYNILQSPPSVSMMSDIKDDQAVFAEPDRVPTSLDIPHAEVSNSESSIPKSSTLKAFARGYATDEFPSADDQVHLDSPVPSGTTIRDFALVESGGNFSNTWKIAEGIPCEAFLAAGITQTSKTDKTITEALTVCSVITEQQQLDGGSEVSNSNTSNESAVKTSTTKSHRSNTAFQATPRNFWLFVLWFFIISRYELPPQRTADQTMNDNKYTPPAASVTKPMLITSAPTILPPTTTMPPIAAKATSHVQTIFPTMVISPIKIVTPYRIVKLTSIREGADLEPTPTPTPDYEELIPPEKEKTNLIIMGLFCMVVVASALCADSIL
ncbi:hypothetical protein V8E51_015792 [Hyaloscypha variabilis]